MRMRCEDGDKKSQRAQVSLFNHGLQFASPQEEHAGKIVTLMLQPWWFFSELGVGFPPAAH